MDGVLSVLTEATVDGIALWVVALICVGVFLASFMDAIAGGRRHHFGSHLFDGSAHAAHLLRTGDQ